jgi:hypothetical protein
VIFSIIITIHWLVSWLLSLFRQGWLTAGSCCNSAKREGSCCNGAKLEAHVPFFTQGLLHIIHLLRAFSVVVLKDFFMVAYICCL